MPSLINDITALKDLADNLCAGGMCPANGALGTQCKKLRDTLNQFLKTKTGLCVEQVFGDVNAIFQHLQQAVVADPKSNSFALAILLERYVTWVKELKANQIAISQMGQNAKPVTESNTYFDRERYEELGHSKPSPLILYGAEMEKQEIRQGLVMPFEYPRLFPERTRGVLMYGPPGTGKTRLVSALVNELNNAVLFMPDPSSLKGKFEGQTEASISALYAAATATLDAPAKYDREGKEVPRPKFAIVFIDEADALFGKGREEDASKQRTVNTFLQMMDGANTDSRITTIASTNFPKTIDDAILRRLTLKILVDLPTRAARLELIESLLRKRYDFWGGDSNTMWSNFEQFAYHDDDGKDYVDETDIANLSNLTGPRTEAQKYMTQRDGDDEFHKDAFREAGFSLADMTSALTNAFNVAAARAVSEDAVYVKKTTAKNEIVYVYDPNGDSSNSTLKSMADTVRSRYSDRIVSFDIRMGDIKSALQNMPSSIDVESYKEILTFA